MHNDRPVTGKGMSDEMRTFEWKPVKGNIYFIFRKD